MRRVIISPSGKYYGSEQVLHDYLDNSGLSFSIYIAGRGLLYNKLASCPKKNQIRSFSNVKFLYAQLVLLCIIRKVKTVYVNEAGHSKYILLLSRLFPSVRFIIHVRLLEDTSPARWPGRIGKNVSILTISRYLQNALIVNSIHVYDPFPFSETAVLRASNDHVNASPLIVGIIGRISLTKGIDNVLRLLHLIKAKNLQSQFRFHFFGDVSEDVVESGKYDQLLCFGNVEIKGYIDNKDNIYNSIGCVLHASAKEPLGRIFLEALNYGIPFVGIHSGGIGEIASELDLAELMVDSEEEMLPESFIEKLKFLETHYSDIVSAMAVSREKARRIFDLGNYCMRIDSLIEEKPAYG